MTGSTVVNLKSFGFLAIVILVYCFGVLEGWFLVIPSGRKKRGFKIWSRPLSRMEFEYLNKPLYFVMRYWSKGYIYSFIRAEDNEAIISPASLGRFLFPYIGYVDLSEPVPQLQYRTCLILHLLPILLVFVHIFFLIALPLVAINFSVATKGIDKFLNHKMQANKDSKK